MRFNAIKVYFSLASESSAGGRGGRRELTSAPSSHEGTRLLPSVLPHPLGLGVFHWVLCIRLADRKREAHEEPWGGCAIWRGGQEVGKSLLSSFLDHNSVTFVHLTTRDPGNVV